MMYSITFQTNNRHNTIVGDLNSILALTHILENLKTYFTVANVQGFVVTQKQLGCGDFKYWKDSSF